VQVGAGGWSDSKRTIYDRHGIRIVFTVSGKVGRWDFQNFILRKSPADAYDCYAICTSNARCFAQHQQNA
jgi:hypothetical protein